jgi:plastocyanin
LENETLFYIFGGALTLVALVTSFVGIRSHGFPGSRPVMAGVIGLFAVLVATTAVFAVAGARDEQAHREAEQAEEAHGEGESAQATEEEGGAEGSSGAQGGAGRGGETLTLAALPEEIAYDKDSLSAAPGEVTIEFSNPSPVVHDVAILRDGEEIAKTEQITDADASLTTDLDAGSYEFICTVPGHAEAGMRGTLEVG